ncbi:MAG: SDR family oxidoreductase [Acidimicrobiales bacterium]
MDLALGSKRCIITGGSKGIGAACADLLAAEGARVAIIARGAADLEATAAELTARHGEKVAWVAADLSSAEGVEAGVGGAIEALGGVDCLVNNAGSSKAGPLDTLSDDDWYAAIDLKLMGYVRAMRHVLGPMRAQRSGRIVNIAGAAARNASAGYVLGCFNAALQHVTRSVAELVAAEGITVNVINPGPIATERWDEMVAVQAAASGVSLAEASAKAARSLPVGRVGQPVEVADMVAYLCSDRSGFQTGGSLLIDGGAARGLV